ncbi:MAG: response regulator transcription factor [Pyrinomonadaceae bacterium]
MNSPKRHILYIEDHEDTRELITLVLKQKNCEVTTAATVQNGIELANEGNFDLYLLDSWLPDGSGLDLCKRIREFDQRTPILFYSAAAYEVDKDLAMSSGAQGYLIKPSQTSELCDLVIMLIDEAANHTHSAVQRA